MENDFQVLKNSCNTCVLTLPLVMQQQLQQLQQRRVFQWDSLTPALVSVPQPWLLSVATPLAPSAPTLPSDRHTLGA